MNIPEAVLESLQSQLQVEGRKLCKEIAKILAVPEKELITNVLLKLPKLQVITSEESQLSCPVPVKRDTILERCRHTCVLGTKRCISHQNIKDIDSNFENLPAKSLHRIEYSEPLWTDIETNLVYNSSFEIVGSYDNGNLQLLEKYSNTSSATFST